jgi:hypothetical protein
MEQTPDKVIAMAERLAAALSPLDEIALVLEMNVLQLEAELKARSSPIAKAVIRGRLLTTTAWRESVIKQALNGSSPAQTMVADMVKRTT